MCAATFKAVKDLAGELGCVTKDGMQADRLHHVAWWQLFRQVYGHGLAGRFVLGAQGGGPFIHPTVFLAQPAAAPGMPIRMQPCCSTWGSTCTALEALRPCRLCSPPRILSSLGSRRRTVLQ